MSERSGLLLVGGGLQLGTVRTAGGRITSLELSDEAPRDTIVAPGLVDLHVHGYGGCDPLEDLAGMARALAAHGTTSFQPTLFPDRPEALAARVAEIAEHSGRASDPLPAARVLGTHLEGPFVNPEQAGALPREALVAPSPGALEAILAGGVDEGGIRTVTVAPELPGAGDLIGELTRCGVRVSLGHSLATAQQAHRAAERGARGVTHLYNAMSGFHHREPGLAGFALGHDEVFVEIIGDLVHSDRAAFELALAARGPRQLMLVSDALRGAGTGCDAFHWHGRDHEVRGGAAYWRCEDGNEPVLAGSALGLLDMVRRLVGHGITSIEDALTMASETPARAAGLQGEIGVLSAGARADLIVLRRADLELVEVLTA